MWIDHIEGKDPSLGIIPIRDDSTCIWGCIDIDTYPLDHKKIIRKIRELKLPLVMCRSKSGRAHVFLFAKEPIKAKLIRDKLIEWAGELGYANCEIFPKQIEIKILLAECPTERTTKRINIYCFVIQSEPLVQSETR